ncbi:hypothetical protein V8C86DRAFT_2491300 [Haematococcus lacustris]
MALTSRQAYMHSVLRTAAMVCQGGKTVAAICQLIRCTNSTDWITLPLSYIRLFRGASLPPLKLAWSVMEGAAVHALPPAQLVSTTASIDLFSGNPARGGGSCTRRSNPCMSCSRCTYWLRLGRRPTACAWCPGWGSYQQDRHHRMFNVMSASRSTSIINLSHEPAYVSCHCEPVAAAGPTPPPQRCCASCCWCWPAGQLALNAHCPPMLLSSTFQTSANSDIATPSSSHLTQ